MRVDFDLDVLDSILNNNHVMDDDIDWMATCAATIHQ
jgi:hypothetical protein